MKLKVLPTHGLELIHYGVDFPYIADRVLADSDLGKLERQEGYVYWFRPRDSSSLEAQIPAVKSGDVFYQLSLRMMKCIWRHVRLRRNFHNVERALSGGLKLRIPLVLYVEKKRTQHRFQVRVSI